MAYHLQHGAAQLVFRLSEAFSTDIDILHMTTLDERISHSHSPSGKRRYCLVLERTRTRLVRWEPLQP